MVSGGSKAEGEEVVEGETEADTVRQVLSCERKASGSGNSRLNCVPM